MKKFLAVLAASLFFTSLSMAQTTALWGSNGAVPPQDNNLDLLGPDGTAVPLGSNWLVELYTTTRGQLPTLGTEFPWDVDTLVQDTTTAGPVRDVTAVAGSKAGQFIGSFNTGTSTASPGELLADVAGKDVYTVIYNNADKNAAQYYAVIDDAVYSVPALASPPTPVVFYNAGTLGGGVIGVDNGGEWAAIPEPGTFVIMGLGGLLVFLRRRARS